MAIHGTSITTQDTGPVLNQLPKVPQMSENLRAINQSVLKDHRQPYEKNEELQNWLCQNWTVGSKIIQSIAIQQNATMRGLYSQIEQIPNQSPKMVNLLLEMNKIQQESENKMANLLALCVD